LILGGRSIMDEWMKGIDNQKTKRWINSSIITYEAIFKNNATIKENKQYSERWMNNREKLICRETRPR